MQVARPAAGAAVQPLGKAFPTTRQRVHVVRGEVVQLLRCENAQTGAGQRARDLFRYENDGIAAYARENAVVQAQRVGDTSRVQIAVHRQWLPEKRIGIAKRILTKRDAEPSEI